MNIFLCYKERFYPEATYILIENDDETDDFYNSNEDFIDFGHFEEKEHLENIVENEANDEDVEYSEKVIFPIFESDENFIKIDFPSLLG